MMAAKLNEYRDDETSFFRLALDYPLITDEPTEICFGKKFACLAESVGVVWHREVKKCVI